MENGIPIKPFFGEENDRELEYLTLVLERMGNYDDSRAFIRDNFKLNSFYAYLRSTFGSYHY